MKVRERSMRLLPTPASKADKARQAVRAQIAQVMTLFQGRVYHQVFAQD